MSRGARARAWMAALAATLLGVAACEDGAGSGRLVQARVVGAEELGAVVLEVRWPGVEGFEGLGSTQVYHAPLPGEEDAYRLILLSPDGSTLRFAARQALFRTAPPAVTVEDAVGADNLPVETAKLRVRVDERRGIW